MDHSYLLYNCPDIKVYLFIASILVDVMHVEFMPLEYNFLGKTNSLSLIIKTRYHIFSKYGPGVNYFQMASDQALN